MSDPESCVRTAGTVCRQCLLTHLIDRCLPAHTHAHSLDCGSSPPSLPLLCLQVQAAPPKPSDETVFIEERGPLDVYVKAFGGWAVGQTYLQVCGGGWADLPGHVRRGCVGGGETYLQVCWFFCANRSAHVWGFWANLPAGAGGFWQLINPMCPLLLACLLFTCSHAHAHTRRRRLT